eukprot:gene13692-19583_t
MSTDCGMSPVSGLFDIDIQECSCSSSGPPLRGTRGGVEDKMAEQVNCVSNTSRSMDDVSGGTSAPTFQPT